MILKRGFSEYTLGDGAWAEGARVAIHGNPRDIPLQQVTATEIKVRQSIVAKPECFAVNRAGDKITFWPVPNNEYTVRIELP